MQAMNLEERLISIPKIVFFYLKTFVFPTDLIIFQSWVVKSLDLSNFYFPLIVDVAFFIFLFFIGRYLWRENRKLFKAFLFFLSWFFIGFIMHLQLFPLDDTVADRWFYFPIVGLLGMLGEVINIFYLKKHIRAMAVPLALLGLLLLSARVLYRNMDWKDQTTLYMHDAKLNNDSPQMEDSLGVVAYLAGDKALAERHYIRATQLYKGETTFSNLGIFYINSKQMKKAAQAYLLAVKQNRNSAYLWEYLAMTQYNAGNKSGALASAEKAYSLSPTDTFLTILRTIQMNYPITFH